MSEELKTIGIKENQLRAMADCDLCGEAVGKSGIFFYRVQVDQVIMNGPAINRQAGLGMMTAPALAMVMGPDEDMAHRIPGEEKTVCARCLPKIGVLLND